MGHAPSTPPPTALVAPPASSGLDTIVRATAANRPAPGSSSRSSAAVRTVPSPCSPGRAS